MDPGRRGLETSPLVLEGVRVAARDHIKSYQAMTRKLQARAARDRRITRGDENIAEDAEDELVIRRAVVKAKLIRELIELHEAASVVEERLVSSRTSTWVKHGLMTFGTCVVASAVGCTSQPGLSSLIPYAYSPVAGLMVGSHELNLANTRNANAAFARLLESAKDGMLFDEDDTAHIVTDKWRKVPWNYVWLPRTAAETPLAPK